MDVTAIQHYVCQYSACGAEQFGECTDMGASTHKGWAHTYPLHVTQLFTAGGCAVHVVPQVHVRVRGRGADRGALGSTANFLRARAPLASAGFASPDR